MEVNMAVAVALADDDGTGDGVDDGVAVTCCPHAMDNQPMTRKTMTCKNFFILTHSLGAILDVLLLTVYP